MWKAMEGWGHEAFMPSTDAGVAKVLSPQKYAYILESTMNEFYRQRNCDLLQLGGPLDTIGYALAFPKGSPLVRNFSLAILALQNNQAIQKLYDKWWKEMLGGNSTVCGVDEDKDKKIKGLKADQIGGVFVLLVGGILAGVLMLAIEKIFKFRMQPVVRVFLCGPSISPAAK